MQLTMLECIQAGKSPFNPWCHQCRVLPLYA